MAADAAVRSRRSPVLVAATALDAIATAGLCLLAAGAFVRGEALGLVFVGAAAGLAAIPGAVLSGVALRRAARRRGWPRGRFAVTVTGLALAAALVGPAVLVAAWNATPNPAAAAAAPLEQRIRAVGGTPLCSDGDPGRGPDNVVPWHHSYFSVPRDEASPRRLERLAGSAGFGDLRPGTGRASSFGDSRRYTLRSTATTGPHADLAVEVSPTGTQLACGPDYGRSIRPSPGRVLVDLTWTLGPTR